MKKLNELMDLSPYKLLVATSIAGYQYKIEAEFFDDVSIIPNDEGSFAMMTPTYNFDWRLNKLCGYEYPDNYENLDLTKTPREQMFIFPKNKDILWVAPDSYDSHRYSGSNGWWYEENGVAGGYSEHDTVYGLRKVVETVLYTNETQIVITLEDGVEHRFDTKEKLQDFIRDEGLIFYDNKINKIEKEKLQCLLQLS